MTTPHTDQNAESVPSLDLDAIKARAAEASEGPWEARVVEAGFYIECSVSGWFAAFGDSFRDAEFIAHAREDIPALVAEVERLRGLLSAVVDDITAEMNLARQAYRSTPTDHFAHDYCRWVGHAEAYSNALNFIDQNKEAH